ncbi:PDZ domain-containing protein, partial [Cytophagia bacterium CHB2]|nr:PDZ domain-containing protein [Cytophagia bacterium CHB2]
PYLGVSVKNQNNQAVIAEVAEASPAAQAGLEADDRLLACDDKALAFDNWQEVVQAKPVGTKINLLIARRGRIRKLEVTLAAQPAASFEFSISETAAAEANTLRAQWWQPYAGRETK